MRLLTDLKLWPWLRGQVELRREVIKQRGSFVRVPLSAERETPNSGRLLSPTHLRDGKTLKGFDL